MGSNNSAAQKPTPGSPTIVTINPEIQGFKLTDVDSDFTPVRTTVLDCGPIDAAENVNITRLSRNIICVQHVSTCMLVDIFTHKKLSFISHDIVLESCAQPIGDKILFSYGYKGGVVITDHSFVLQDEFYFRDNNQPIVLNDEYFMIANNGYIDVLSVTDGLKHKLKVDYYDNVPELAYEVLNDPNNSVVIYDKTSNGHAYKLQYDMEPQLLKKYTPVKDSTVIKIGNVHMRYTLEKGFLQVFLFENNREKKQEMKTPITKMDIMRVGQNQVVLSGYYWHQLKITTEIYIIKHQEGLDFSIKKQNVPGRMWMFTRRYDEKEKWPIQAQKKTFDQVPTMFVDLDID
jgi:hypothetical protein